ncbi:MAG: glycoside hydrolase, partial [Longimicrobiales bacterium]|nr:glycoside hydrolase [Longimicrobiales bacterium]
RVLDRHLRDAGLGTRVEIPEAARIDFLYSGDTDHPRRDDQLDVLFRQAALDSLPRVAPKVAGHSYFTTWPVARMVATRRALRDSLDAIAPGLEYWMTEYCVLEDNEEIEGPGRDLGMHPALYTARLIHFDLALAGAASWQWWLAVSAGDYKDGLVYVDVESRQVHDSKLLWALGHWSRFLRPGSVRLGTTRSDDATPVEQATGLMVSGYRSADGRPVAVAVNYDSVPRPLALAVDGIGADGPRAWRPYITDRGRNLAPAAAVTAGATAEVPARSVVTFIGLERGPSPIREGPEPVPGDPEAVPTDQHAAPGNPIVRELFTADPAALVHDGRLYVFSGRDQASPTQADFVMREWHAFSTDTATTDPAAWEHHGPLLALDDFAWADANAWASEVVRGPDGRFYWFVSTRWAEAPADGDRMAIGVAVADHPLGPWRDAIGGPLVTALLDSASAHNIDPTVLVDTGGVHMYWGSFWEPRHVRLDASMTALAGGITTPDGLPGFWEAPWLFERDGVYYMLYASNRNLDDDCVTSRFYACIRYATADHPAGPWTHRGIALGQVSSTTNHPAAVEFPEGSDRWWMVYHTADLPGGGTFRRSVAIDRMTFAPDGRIRTVEQTRAPAPEPRPVPSDDASRFAAVECSYTSPWESCDALASGPEPESSDMPGPNIGT